MNGGMLPLFLNGGKYAAINNESGLVLEGSYSLVLERGYRESVTTPTHPRARTRTGGGTACTVQSRVITRVRWMRNSTTDIHRKGRRGSISMPSLFASPRTPPLLHTSPADLRPPRTGRPPCLSASPASFVFYLLFGGHA